MNANQLVTVVVATTFLIGGAAAVGAASPAEAATVADADTDADAPADSGEDADSVGPSDGLPEQVPDFVSDVHEGIEGFLSGSVDALGEALSGLLGEADATNDGVIHG